MADNTAKIILTARDDTKAGFDSARRNMSGLVDDAASIGGKLGVLQGAFVALAASAAVVNIKGAIDAADQLDDLAEKTGITVEALGSLKYAGEVTGTPLESMAKGVQKLSINMAAAAGGGKEQAAVFQALGISVKALDGSLRGSDQVLGDIADRFANFKDGPEKAALAVELFGKAGADMIPLLNQGSAGIKDLRAEADRLGISFGSELAGSAAEFNDNLKKIQLTSQGFFTTVAGELLPALNELSRVFLESREGGNSFAEMLGGGLKNILEAVTVAGANVSFVLQGIGREAGAVAAQAVALAKLDLAGFDAISAAVKEDGIKARAELDALERRILNVGQSHAGAGRGTAADPRIVGQVGSIKEQTAAWREVAPVVAKAGEAAKKTADEFANLYAKISGKDAGVDADFQKNLATLKAGLDKGRISRDDYVKAVEAYIKQQPFAVKAAKEEADSLEELSKAALKTAEARQAARTKESDGIQDWLRTQEAATAATLAGVNERAQSLQAESDAAALAAAQNISLASAIELVTIKRLEEKQTGLIAGSEAYEAITREIAARRTLIGLINTKDLREKESAGWTNVWASLDNTAHDVFTNIFEGGSNAFKKLGQTLKASVLDLLYQMVARPFIISVGASVLGSGFSAAASAATGGTGSAAGSFASSALGSTLFGGSTLASIGSSIGTGFMATVSGQSIGAAAAAYSAAGQAGVATGLQAGAAIPYVAAALAAAAALGLFRSTKTVGSGLMGTVGESSDITGYDLRRKSGYLLGGPDYSIRETALDTATSKSITDAVALISSGSRAYADALGLGTQALTGFTTTLGSDLIHPDTGGTGISFEGLNAEQITAKIQTELAKVGDAYAQRLIGTFAEVTTTTTIATDEVTRAWDAGLQDFVDTIVSRAGTVSTTTETTYTASEFARAGETAGQTLTRLATSLSAVNSLWQAMGTTLLAGSLSSGDAASRLADAAGGLDALSSSVGGYYESMFSAEEKRVNTVRLYTAALQAQNQQIPVSVEAYRQQVAYLESIVATEPAAAAALATMYAMAPAFASVNQALSDTTGAIDRTTADITRNLQSLQDASQGLARDLLAAQGGDLRAFDTAGYTAAELAIYDHNEAIRAEIAAISQATAAAEQRAGIENTLLQSLGETATLRQRELNALDPANRAFQSMVYAVQDAQSAISSLTADIAQLDQIAAQASTLSNSLSVMLGGADNTEAGLWATVNSATATAEQRLTAVGSLMNLINGSITADTAAAQRLLTEGANAANTAAASLIATQTRAAETQISNAEKLLNLGQQLRDYVSSLRIGSSSALTPSQRLALAGQQYSGDLSGAQAGNTAAMSSLQGSASSYLELARQYNPGAYSQIFEGVTTTLDTFGSSLMTEGQQAAATASAQLSTLQSIATTTSTATSEAVLGNVISAANQTAIESLLGVTTQIEAQAVLDRATAQARVTEETARMEAIRTSLSDAGIIATSTASTANALASFAAQNRADNAQLVAEIQTLNARIATLEGTIVQVGAAQIDTAVSVGNTTAQVVATAVSTSTHAATLAPEVV